MSFAARAGFEVLAKHAAHGAAGLQHSRDRHLPHGQRSQDVSVLNKWNQSHDIKNLFVVDGSSFVSGGSQNPTMTILALSMRAADYMAEQMRTGTL